MPRLAGHALGSGWLSDGRVVPLDRAAGIRQISMPHSPGVMVH
jgi:hypothetical protein